jgi:chemotaxis protein methyltransferase CheR
MLDEVVPVEVVRHFCHIATARLGVDIGDRLRPLVAGRVAKRLRTLRVDPDEYVKRLHDDPECSEVVGFLDFFRPRPPRLFARRDDYLTLHAALVRWLKEGRLRIRLWCAGCGTGEEAYAMALMSLAAIEAAKVALHEVSIKVLATDVSRPVLERARQGIFAEEQLRGFPRATFGRYFQATEAGLAIDEDVKDMVCFRRLNLARIPYPMSGLFEGIFCRDGLAPLVPSARKRAMDAMRALLSERGRLYSGLGGDVLAEHGDGDDDLGWAQHAARGLSIGLVKGSGQ